jgi:uncharacterized protein
MKQAEVKQLFIHPVKGLTPKAQQSVTLKVGYGIPGDRSFALMYKEDEINVDSTIVPWMKKENFIMQNDWHSLAALDCEYEEGSGIFRVKGKGVELLVSDTKTEIGRDRISAFFTGYLAGINPSLAAKNSNHPPLQFVGMFGETRYPDREAVHISLVSQATIDNLSQLAGQQIDVRRFRPNIVIEGVPAWGEFDWVGQEMQLGTARIEISARINRCLNIEVHPETGERDIGLLTLLQKQFHHIQTGVLAKVISNGDVAIGDNITSV